MNNAASATNVDRQITVVVVVVSEVTVLECPRRVCSSLSLSDVKTGQQQHKDCFAMTCVVGGSDFRRALDRGFEKAAVQLMTSRCMYAAVQRKTSI